MTVEMSAIRAGIIANLASITGCQKSATRTGNHTPPSLVVTGFDEMDPTTFHAGGSGGSSFVMLVQGLAGMPTRKSAEVQLDKWLSPLGSQNVWNALQSDRTLSGTVSNSAVISCDGTQVITLDNGTEMLGSTWHLQIEL